MSASGVAAGVASKARPKPAARSPAPRSPRALIPSTTCAASRAGDCRGVPSLENLEGFTPAAASASALASSVGRNYDPTFDWDRLQEIRDLWQKKLIVKGIVLPDDAQRAAALGVDAIVVSNHGGRQLDDGIATFDALPGVVAAAWRACRISGPIW